jgi:hypothetical protein
VGIYYNPPPPFMGAQQPLTPEKLVPPISGPPPTNPPFLGARIAQAILASWTAVAPMPVMARNRVPDPPVVTAPPFRSYNYAIHNAWLAAAPPSQSSTLLNPPVSGPVEPTPDDPPFMGGAQVSEQVLVAWLPRPPDPIVARNLDPPISGPPPEDPPFMGGAQVPEQVLLAWLPKPPQPIVTINLPILEPPIGYTPIGARVPAAVMSAWLPPPPDPIVARNLEPPISGPLPSPFRPIGTRIPIAVQVSWIPPPPQPPVVFNGAIETQPVVGVLAATEQADTAQVIVEVRSDAPGILNFGRRVTINRW